ncbi:MAG: beta-agarase [Pirellulales bacterium]|nr:beta-agarase [Pirellulales bacterium]
MFHRLCVVVVFVLCAVVPTGLVCGEEAPLLDLGSRLPSDAVQTADAKAALTSGPSGRALTIITGRDTPWPGITLKAPGGRWDLSAYRRILLDVKNVGVARINVHCRIDGPVSNEEFYSLTENVAVEPGEKRTLSVELRRRAPAALAAKLVGMRGYPGGYRADLGINVGNVNQLIVFVSDTSAGHAFEVQGVRAAGKAPAPPRLPEDIKALFPLIDRYGQYIHAEWPGKTHSDEDLHRAAEQERRELAARPGPNDWDRYGGWTAGPQLPAKGFFRAEKYKGKWWLVDPEGRLFWSHGVDCVGAGFGHTPLTDREHYFQDLPDRNSPLGRFYGRGSGAPLGYYKDKNHESFDFAGANLLRKYGDDYRRRFNEIAHGRLRSWGMNTLGNWSSRDLCETRKTPYVASIGSGGRRLEGSQGHWGKFPDVFDPGFSRETTKRMESHRGFSVGDPWCIGYFIDNELGWGGDCSLAEATLASPPDQIAKKVFLDDLKAKFGTIEALNQAWGTAHASWDALLECRTPPDRARARDELTAFYARTAERYFRVCREAVKSVAPEQLYLGCRFAAAISWDNDAVLRAAAKHCDLLSFNPYCRGVAEQRLPPGVDMPVLIGEFHFGAVDRGLFHPGLVETADQAERAAAYANYVREALANPAVVGAHWFQFGDEPTTGRMDGENYQIGLIDVCDNPYPETIRAVREAGATMYRRRLGE